jgi:outer membrane protein TolC
LKQNQAVIAAAREAEKGAVYGPLIPSVGAQVFAGALGGGGAMTTGFGESEDYIVTLGWRLGPGGLFDRGRIHATQSRMKLARLDQAKLLDEVTRQVVEAQTRLQSQVDQMAAAGRAIEAADQTLRLSQERKQFGVGAVLETIQAEEELTRARLEYFNSLAEYNKAQYALHKAIGGFSSPLGRNHDMKTP